MSDRNISCQGCSSNMGTIRDARLRINIAYFCNKCVDHIEAKISRLEHEVRTMRNADKRYATHWIDHEN
jgi:hypothetical protein